MMTFTNEEIIFSVISSLTYGVLFSVLFCIVKIGRGIGRLLINQLTDAFVLQENSKENERKTSKSTRNLGPFTIIFLSIVFTIGFCLLSYLSLDGEIRLYMLILSFAAFYLSKFAFFDFLEKAILFILDKTFCLISRILAALFLPIIKAIKKLYIFIIKKYIYLLDKCQTK